MASARTRRRPSQLGARLRRGFSGATLVAVGACIGVVVGTVWSVPELLWRRLREPVERVELPAPPAEGDAPLREFEELQTPVARRPPKRAPSPAPVSARVERPAAESSRPPPAPEQASAPAPAPSAAALPTPSAEEVIAELARREAAPAARGDGKVVQVAAYKDRRSAEALARRLQDSGFDSFLSNTDAAGQTRFRVRVRPRAGEDAERVAAALEARGFSVWVTRE